MSDPRFRPQDFAQIPSLFGKDQALEWKSLDEIASFLPTAVRLAGNSNAPAALLRAAQFQHYYSWAIRVRLKGQGINMKTYASMTGLKYDRLAGVLRGQAIMRLEDIAMADVVLGDISVFARRAAEAGVIKLESAETAQANRDAARKRFADRN